MDVCKYSIEMIAVRLKKRFFFEKKNMLLLKELLKQWMTVTPPVKVNTVPFKEWMVTILSMTKADTLLHGMDGQIEYLR